MPILKALGGFFSFFGILFGGLLDLIFQRNSDTSPETVLAEPVAPAVNSLPPKPPTEPQVVVPQPPIRQPAVIAVQPVTSPNPVFIPSPFGPNCIPDPRPSRRPGKTMAQFKAMAEALSLGR
jgi:hypothetical protein